jgi:hypothetical protein
MAKKLGKKKTVEVEKYHPFICTPAYDGKVDADYALSLAEACFCSPLFQVQVTASVTANGAFIELARNQYVKWFLEEHTDCTHLFFIDSDLKFPANAFMRIDVDKKKKITPSNTHKRQKWAVYGLRMTGLCATAYRQGSYVFAGISSRRWRLMRPS